MGATDSFLALAAQHPQKVADAVERAHSPYQTLALLGFGGQARRAIQLCDAIVYYGWDTSHWTKPIVKDEAFHDFGAWTPNSTGEHGERFEATFLYELEAQVSELDHAVTFYPEDRVEEWTPVSLPTPPWDAVLAFGDKRAVVFEAKVSRKGVGRLRKQMRARAAWLEAMKTEGWTVKVAVVVGRQVLPDNLSWVKELNAAGHWTGGLQEISVQSFID